MTPPRRAGGGRHAASRPVILSLSGRNQLRAIVEEIRISGVMAQVRVRIGDQRLTAIITRDAVDQLRLRRGDEALAVIKATEVMIAREGFDPRPAKSAGSRWRRNRRPIVGEP